MTVARQTINARGSLFGPDRSLTLRSLRSKLNLWHHCINKYSPRTMVNKSVGGVRQWWSFCGEGEIEREEGREGDGGKGRSWWKGKKNRGIGDKREKSVCYCKHEGD